MRDGGAMSYDKLYEYYQRTSLLPTYGNLADVTAFDRYEDGRRRLFSEKLYLPPLLFRDANVVEFGPDTGENALVFARWGANLTLVEPNGAAIPQIEKYFKRFGLAGRITKIASTDFDGFDDGQVYDVVDAEGFIYTIKPTEHWLRRFVRLLRPEGFAIITYYERRGAFFELGLKALHAAAKAVSGRDTVATARTLFQAKWDAIPHTRAFEAWVMDVMENPFVRLKYFLDADMLCAAAQEAGLALYSSWPVYRAPLDIYWHKRNLSAEQRRARDSDHLARSCLSFLAGDTLYLTGSAKEAAGIMRLIDEAVGAIDAIIGSPSAAAIEQALRGLENVQAAVRTASVLPISERARPVCADVLEALKQALAALARGDFTGACRITNGAPAFVAHWGMPHHFAVFQRCGPE